MDGYDATILIEAASRGHAPGTVSLIEPDLTALATDADQVVNAHSMNGCEPTVLETEALGLSASAQAAVPQAVEMTASLVCALREGTVNEFVEASAQ